MKGFFIQGVVSLTFFLIFRCWGFLLLKEITCAKREKNSNLKQGKIPAPPPPPNIKWSVSNDRNCYMVPFNFIVSDMVTNLFLNYSSWVDKKAH